MLRRLTLMLLITILPIQSWAVVDMRLQKEALQLSTSSVPSQDTHHLCHQDVAANADDQNTESNHASCNACSLCMAFGAILMNNSILRFDSPAQSFFTHLQSFNSEDLSLGNKPPIL